jgi:tetratricopeptide (TPR) repeat protein
LSARVYASENLLATAWANAQPDSLRAQGYLAQRLSKSGHLEQALRIIDAAKARHPDNAGIEANRIYLLCSLGTLGDHDVDELDELLRTAPFDRSAFENMETLRILATSNHCPALNGDRWEHSVDIMLDNPAYRDNPVSNGSLHYQKHFWAVQHGDLNMAISELDATYRADPDANIPRLQAKYLASAGLRDQAIDVLRTTDTGRLPLMRRLLVDDKAINAETITAITRMK